MVNGNVISKRWKDKIVFLNCTGRVAVDRRRNQKKGMTNDTEVCSKAAVITWAVHCYGRIDSAPNPSTNGVWVSAAEETKPLPMSGVELKNVKQNQLKLQWGEAKGERSWKVKWNGIKTLNRGGDLCHFVVTFVRNWPKLAAWARCFGTGTYSPYTHTHTRSPSTNGKGLILICQVRWAAW